MSSVTHCRLVYYLMDHWYVYSTKADKGLDNQSNSFWPVFFLRESHPSRHTIRKVKFLSKNSILTKKPQHFHEFFSQYFLTIFLMKSKLSTAKKSKTTTFSRVFPPNFLGKSKLNFWTKNEDFEQCARIGLGGYVVKMGFHSIQSSIKLSEKGWSETSKSPCKSLSKSAEYSVALAHRPPWSVFLALQDPLPGMLTVRCQWLV